MARKKFQSWNELITFMRPACFVEIFIPLGNEDAGSLVDLICDEMESRKNGIVFSCGGTNKLYIKGDFVSAESCDISREKVCLTIHVKNQPTYSIFCGFDYSEKSA